jgi:L-ascorbate metabolism protein UlaG (beta-lactamase superfamily)
LIRVAGKTIFIDPMMGPDTSPIAPFVAKRFTGSLLHILEQLPHVDAVLITHDHYDHLDMDSIDILMSKTDRFITALGVGRHLQRWNCPVSKIEEMDWWQETDLDGLKITFTQSRHSSGRAVSAQPCTLWGGWVIDSGKERVYFSGDGGYGQHFKEVGERLGPFDFGFMECGQYNEKWRVIHMHPDESVQAAIDAGVKQAMPVHWAGFTLAMHDWTEPVTQFMSHANAQNLSVATPQIGELQTISTCELNEWWK